jgi:hypothetical protein
MNAHMNMHMTVNARRWNGVALGIIVALMVHLTAGPNAVRTDEPWPMLLSDNSTNGDAGLTPLQQRANGSLEKLVQSARAAEEL